MTTNKRAVDRVIDMLNDPSEVWILDHYTLSHARTGLEIWVSNMPVLNTNTYPNALNIGLLDKWRLWKAANAAKENSILRMLEVRK